MEYIWIKPETGENNRWKTIDIAVFLEKHLEEFGDKQSDIVKAIQYALNPNKGGLVLLAVDGQEMKGAVVINKTGMDGYIPAHILVYIAVHSSTRGQGVGKKMMQEVMAECPGGIALHVEPNNPAKFLYEKLGFTNKYLEMRYLP